MSKSIGPIFGKAKYATGEDYARYVLDFLKQNNINNYSTGLIQSMINANYSGNELNLQPDTLTAPGTQYAQMANPNVATDANADASVNPQDIIFDRVFNRTLGEEGGYEDRDNRIDTPTNMGIQQATLNRFRSGHPELAQGYPDNVRDLTLHQARQIARVDYFDKYRIGEIESEPLQELMFDSFFNHTPDEPALWAQRAINQNTNMQVDEDNIFGSQTINAINNLTPEEIVRVNNAIVDMRLGDYTQELETNRNPNYREYTTGLPGRIRRFRIR